VVAEIKGDILQGLKDISMAIPKGNSTPKVEETAGKVVNISKALNRGLEVWGNGAYHHTSNEDYDSRYFKII